MKLLAGTSNGVFAIENGVARQVHGSGDVRDLISSGERVFASTGAGLYRSDDAGESWQLAGMVDREVWQTRSAGNGVWYAGTQPPGLFRSTDDGDSWSEVGSFAQAPEAADWSLPTKPISPARARALVIDRDDPKRIWVGVEVGGIMRTDDGGTSWALVVPGDNPDLHMIYAHPQKPEELYASAGYGRLDGVAEMVEGNAGVFRSDDGGVTWHYAWKGITPRYTRPMCVDRSLHPCGVPAPCGSTRRHRSGPGVRPERRFLGGQNALRPGVRRQPHPVARRVDPGPHRARALRPQWGGHGRRRCHPTHHESPSRQGSRARSRP